MTNTNLEIFLKCFVKKYDITLQNIELEKSINKNTQTKKIISMNDYKNKRR